MPATSPASQCTSARHRVVVGLGSNYGDREKNVNQAIEWLRGILKGFESSEVYFTKALDGHSPDYANAVGGGYTELCAEELTQMCKEYETVSGRIPGKIIIDIDVVVYDEDVLRPKDFAQSYFVKGFQEIEQKHYGF